MVVITDSFGGILDDWLSRRGLSRQADVRRHRYGKTSLSLSRWTKEVQNAVALAPGTARGLEIGAGVQLRHTGPLGYIVVNSNILAELLETYLLFEKWFYGQNWASANTTENQFAIAWDQRTGVPDRLVEQLHAAAFLTVLRQSCPAAGNPLVVEIMNDEGGEGKAYEDAFGCPVLFGKPALRLVFPAEALQSPVDLDGASINTTWQACQRTLREAQPNATRFVRDVQEVILHYLPTGAPADLAAATLNLSRRTLQRRLTDAGCTYRQLLDGIRERHAACLLADKQLNLQEIAFLLGYSEQSAFNHAYHRWTGISPSEARR